MSSKGFLFITESVRDAFEKELDEAFGKDEWDLMCPKEWSDVWIDADFPEEAIIEVIGAYDNSLGQITISVKHYIEDYGGGKFIVAEPDKIISLKHYREQGGEKQ